MMALFQYINFNYLTLFKSSEFLDSDGDQLKDEELSAKIQMNIAEYNKV